MKNSRGIVLGLAALLCGCSPTESNKGVSALLDGKAPAEEMASEPNEQEVRFTPPVVADDKEVTYKLPEAPEPLSPLPAASRAVPRLLVYHAEVRVKVDDLAQTSARLDSLVRRSGGYASASVEARENGEWRQLTTIRVQPSRFGTLLSALSGLGKVEERKLNTEDVTAEHADVAARLRAKRALEQRYLVLLGQAKKVSDLLEIEEKMGEAREEIESTESRLKALNDQVSYSTITLACYQPLAQTVPDAPLVSFSSRLVGALYDGWSLLTALFIGVVSVWPLLVLGTVSVWALRRWRRRRTQLTA